MAFPRRISTFAIICGAAALYGCSDPERDPARLPRAVAQVDTPHAAALANSGLAAKPAEPVPAGDSAPGVVASVEIKPWTQGASENKVTGAIQFAPTTTGLELSGALKNLPAGLHGLHIHENGDCSNPGGHFAPASNRHGDPANGEHHLGDLGNVDADASNQAAVSINVPGLALHGKNSILGHALVVHANPDDLHSQPSGNSGDVIGCGIIAADGDAEVRPENRDEAAG
jgi:Cu-Zn family superoxide dismutase